MDWQARVRDAAARGDQETLAALYAERVTDVGPVAASRDWLAVLSGLDATAQTG